METEEKKYIFAVQSLYIHDFWMKIYLKFLKFHKRNKHYSEIIKLVN